MQFVVNLSTAAGKPQIARQGFFISESVDSENSHRQTDRILVRIYEQAQGFWLTGITFCAMLCDPCRGINHTAARIPATGI